MEIVIGILIPFIGTLLGSASVFFMKNNHGKNKDDMIEKLLLGFASGVMIAASVWSLLIPSIEMAKGQKIIAWFPASMGFLLGNVILILLDKIIPLDSIVSPPNSSNERNSKFKETIMMILAVTLHNIPEGMAVGVAFAGAMTKNAGITMTGALALALGIAIQNFPEGAIISMPLKSEGLSKFKSFILGTLSGIVEPIGAVITILLTGIIVKFLPYLLSFAAGAMIYVVVKELIPETQNNRHPNIGSIGVALGFSLMMILDVALG